MEELMALGPWNQVGPGSRPPFFTYWLRGPQHKDLIYKMAMRGPPSAWNGDTCQCAV